MSSMRASKRQAAANPFDSLSSLDVQSLVDIKLQPKVQLVKKMKVTHFKFPAFFSDLLFHF